MKLTAEELQQFLGQLGFAKRIGDVNAESFTSRDVQTTRALVQRHTTGLHVDVRASLVKALEPFQAQQTAVVHYVTDRGVVVQLSAFIETAGMRAYLSNKPDSMRVAMVVSTGSSFRPRSALLRYLDHRRLCIHPTLQDGTHNIFDSNVELLTMYGMSADTQLFMPLAFFLYLAPPAVAASQDDAEQTKTAALRLFFDEFAKANPHGVLQILNADACKATHKAFKQHCAGMLKANSGVIERVRADLRALAGTGTTPLSEEEICAAVTYLESVANGMPLLPGNVSELLPRVAAPDDLVVAASRVLRPSFVTEYTPIVRSIAYMLEAALDRAYNACLAAEADSVRYQAEWQLAVGPLRLFMAALPMQLPEAGHEASNIWRLFARRSQMCEFHYVRAWEKRLQAELHDAVREKELLGHLFALKHAKTHQEYEALEVGFLNVSMRQLATSDASYRRLQTWFHTAYSSRSKFAGMWCDYTRWGFCLLVNTDNALESWHRVLKHVTLFNNKKISNGGVVLDATVGRTHNNGVSAVITARSQMHRALTNEYQRLQGHVSVRDRVTVAWARRHLLNAADGMLARTQHAEGCGDDSGGLGIYVITPSARTVAAGAGSGPGCGPAACAAPHPVTGASLLQRPLAPVLTSACLPIIAGSGAGKPPPTLQQQPWGSRAVLMPPPLLPSSSSTPGGGIGTEPPPPPPLPQQQQPWGGRGVWMPLLPPPSLSSTAGGSSRTAPLPPLQQQQQQQQPWDGRGVWMPPPPPSSSSTTGGGIGIAPPPPPPLPPPPPQQQQQPWGERGV
jgi:hypothetical protein